MTFKPRRRIKTSIAQNLIRTLSKRGLCSRTEALRLVKEGKVRVNGTVMKRPGFRVFRADKIEILGMPADAKAKRYILFYKPRGVVTTRDDEKGRPTIYDYLKDIQDWMAPAGRLDQDSEGLLLLTNDSGYAAKLTDPKSGVSKTYEVWVHGGVSSEDTRKILSGVEIGRNETAAAKQCLILESSHEGAHLRIVLTEGKNREIRRIFEALGKTVSRLLRTHFGPYQLGNLRPGEWREFKKI